MATSSQLSQSNGDERRYAVPESFSLAQTCGPVIWGKGRWPSVAWLDDSLYWVGIEGGTLAWRRVSQTGPGELRITGEREVAGDEAWLRDCAGTERTIPAPADPVIAGIAERFPGVRPFNSGSLFGGVVSCIAGQSITVAAAAITEARIYALYHPGIEIAGRTFWPAPNAIDIAESEPAQLRTTGVTWKRAEAIVAAAKAQLAGDLPSDDEARADPHAARVALRALPLVGAWTAESALLWGLGLDDAFPPNDAALLRAARASYGLPDLDHRGLERIAEGWQPARAWAARWLWTALLGVPES